MVRMRQLGAAPSLQQHALLLLVFWSRDSSKRGESAAKSVRKLAAIEFDGAFQTTYFWRGEIFIITFTHEDGGSPTHIYCHNLHTKVTCRITRPHNLKKLRAHILY